MKYGFRLLLHKNLSDKQKEEAKRLFDLHFLSTNGKYGTGGQSSHSYWRRGILGKPVATSQDKNKRYNYDMVIRRMSKRRRIFAAIRRELVDTFNPNVEWDQCMCSLHLGGTKVHVPLIEEDYDLYFEDGEIKG